MTKTPAGLQPAGSSLNDQLGFRLPYTKRQPTPEEADAAKEKLWTNTKEILLEGHDVATFLDGTPTDSKKANLEKLLDNAREEMLALTPPLGANQAGNVASLNKIIFPIIRRAFSNLLVNELVGVQAMSGPVDQVHTLRLRYPEEGDTNQRIAIQIIKEVVAAKSRKFSSRWTFEPVGNKPKLATMLAGKVIDIEAEIMAALAQDIGAEIDQEFLTYLRILAGEPTSTFDCEKVGGDHTFIGDVHAALAILINRQANLIAAETRRGAGNKIVVSPTALTILQSATTSAFAHTTEEVFKQPTGTKFVGTLNNTIAVYVDQYVDATTPVLVAYKGSEYDAGVFYAPYRFLTSSGVLIDPNTLEPVARFMTRYGVVKNKNAKAYYRQVGIDVKNLTFL